MSDYDAIRALNWSTLKRLAISPLMCRWRVDHPEPDKESYARGRAIHVATLEPERWKQEYIVQPDFGDMRTRAAKEAKADWLASRPPGAVALSAGEYALTERCANTMRTHRIAGPLLAEGRAEETILWTDEETGIECKGRTDFAARYVLDIKSTRRDSIRRFASDVADYMYHAQIAFYHDGAIAAGLLHENADGPYIIACQTTEPYDVFPFRVPLYTLAVGRSLYRTLLNRYAECQAADWWPGLGEKMLDLELPRWAGIEDNGEGDAW